MNKEILEKLYSSLPVKERDGLAGKKFKYVASEAIIDRMNTTFEGNWSVEILDKEIIQDQVLIKVRVVVQDSNNGSFCQEAYASHPVAKYTDGHKAGQIIDVGNSFRSATSKAIKAAVARWGLGLYIEEEEEAHDSVSHPTFSTKTNFNGGQKITPVQQSTPTSAKPVVVIPPLPTNTVIKQVPVKTFSVPSDSVPVNVEEPQAKKNELLTPVQKVAIETIVSVHKLNYTDLLVRALQRTDNLPTDLGTMVYDDAVKVIQYGNNLKNSSR